MIQAISLSDHDCPERLADSMERLNYNPQFNALQFHASGSVTGDFACIS